MTKIITLSREFGSGGRELGRLLAEELGYTYYDREILDIIAQQTQMEPQYIEKSLEKGVNIPLRYGRSFSYYASTSPNTIKLLVIQQAIIKEIATKSNCVIVGRGANAILRDYSPFSIFVYADMESKLARCKRRAPAGENLTYKEMKKKIKEIDGARAKEMSLLSNLKWGDKENYHLCLNTSGVDLPNIAPTVAQYAQYWLGG